jgi:hypothetical protein
MLGSVGTVRQETVLVMVMGIAVAAGELNLREQEEGTIVAARMHGDGTFVGTAGVENLKQEGEGAMVTAGQQGVGT